VMGLAAGWADTGIEVPAGRWYNWLTDQTVDGGTVRLAELLRRFPLALLARE
jgi:(1->4)-alpha-D-glucan 1-alpha-D-glucosylmutase